MSLFGLQFGSVIVILQSSFIYSFYHLLIVVSVLVLHTILE